MTIVNLTPHAIVFCNPEGKPYLTVEPSGSLARVSSHIEVTGNVAGIPVTETVFGDVTGLPEAKPDTIYLVSSIVAQRVPKRKDVFIPSESVRDAEGRIVGCKSLGRI